MALITCPECSSEISDQAASCPKCGYPVRKTPLSDTDENHVQSASVDQIPKTKKPRRMRVYISWFLLFVLVVILILVYRNNRHLINSWFIKDHRGYLLPSQIQTNRYVPTDHTQNLVHGSIIVKAGYQRTYDFSTIPNALNNKVSGRFRASGGTGNDIRVLVMTKDDYTNFVNGHSANSYYDSGQLTVSDIDLYLPPGSKNYVLVFDNAFSLMTDKETNANIDFICTY